MKKIDLAYLAGIIDGEGCIGIYKRMSKKRRTFEYFALFRVGTRSQWLAYRFQFAFGGYIIHSQNLWSWQPKDKDLLNILVLLFPYLHLKRPQVEIVIDFLKSRKIENRLIGIRGLSQKDIALREAQRILVSTMKRNSI